jgi:hypothetical protein
MCIVCPFSLSLLTGEISPEGKSKNSKLKKKEILVNHTFDFHCAVEDRER